MVEGSEHEGRLTVKDTHEGRLTVKDTHDAHMMRSMMQGMSSTSQASDQRCCRRSVSRLPVRAGCGRLNDRLFFLMFAMYAHCSLASLCPCLFSFLVASVSGGSGGWVAKSVVSREWCDVWCDV